MTGTAIGAVIDYLVTNLPAALKAVDPTVILGDDLPTEDGQSWAMIGRQGVGSSTAATGNDGHALLGAKRLDEVWTLDWSFACYRPGPAQKPARDAALALYDAFVLFLQKDLSLGDLLETGGYAEIGRVQLDQTQDATDSGGSGAYRRAQVSGELSFTNRYLPS